MAQDTVQEIKNKLTIQDVVAPYVKLRRAGRSMTGLCPFHKEKTPSFHVSLERGTFHCFGCGEGGDMFTFIQKAEGVDFKEALRMLAEKAGVEVVYNPAAKEKSDKLERLREVMGRAAQWYQMRLPDSPALAYAKQRGLTDATVKDWGLGFAPGDWRALLEALTAEGFSVQELLAVGLVKEADGKPGTYYDRFRNRLMFPIRDVSGRVVAFTGRSLESSVTGQENQPAKYLNSPETELYHKSDILYGLDRAKDAIRTRGFAMLVEGQMDVLHCHQAGWGNAVALSGTALTERHVALLKRYSDNLMLILDSDQAGLAATAKSAQLALSAGLKVKAARLSSGKDPADLITEDAQEFARGVKSAAPVVEFFLAVLAEREKDTHRLIGLAERIVLPLIRAVQSPMERAHFVQSAARALGLSEEAVRESLGTVASPAAAGKGGLSQTARRASAEPARPERTVRDEQLRAVVHAYQGTNLARRVETEYSRITGVHAPLSDALPESLAFEAERIFGEEPSEAAADELLHAFERAVIREAYIESVAELRRAEASGDAAAVAIAQNTCAALSGRLAQLA